MYTEKEIKNILKQLENDEKYYGDFGKQFLSNSGIRTLLRDPLSFGQPTEPHLNLVKGQYFHNAVLEPHKIATDFKIIEAASRNSKVYKDESAGEICLLSKEQQQLDDLIKIMLDTPAANDLIRDIDVEYEVPGLLQLEGEWWKLKADIKNNTQKLIVDIKTTGDIDKFESSANEYNYDSQAYIYSEYFGYDFVFVVACKKSNRIGIFDCSTPFLARGREKVERAVEAYREFGNKEFDPVEYHIKKTL
jgi:hypothetical protein